MEGSRIGSSLADTHSNPSRTIRKTAAMLTV
jgi:hypothetical protein